MRKILVAVTYHNQKRATIHKTIRSVADSASKMDPQWKMIGHIFCHDRSAPGYEQISSLTNEETLGGKRNFAINYARANNFGIIAFLDDDDLFGPSWISGLTNEFDKNPQAIFHPQWNILFGPDWFKVHEHIGSSDARFDSRDAILNNPWSALCAFDPMTITHRYRKHSITDQRESFEDWSFNLDTYCDGIEHIAVPNTFHFLRIRKNSLGKRTDTCGVQHTKYFMDTEIRNKKHATEEYLQEKYAIDDDILTKEFSAIHEIEPLLYRFGQEKYEQEHYGRCQDVSSAIDQLGDLRGVRDIFWTIEHGRTGGAEKALGFASRFLSRFPLSDIRRQVWIDDLVAAKPGSITPTAWAASIRNVLKAWQDEPSSQARSIHICNTFMGWQAMTFNPNIFDKVQVYFYVFNDDLRFKTEKYEPETKGYHSPLYRFSDMIDRPNFHVITDSNHFADRIFEKTGISDRIHVIDIPVIQQASKKKKKPTDKIDILWAGRLDDFKGIELLCEVAEMLDPKKFEISVYGEGKDKYKEMIKNCKGPVTYFGPYKTFEYIDEEYDFFLFTSEREGMPNVVKEALSSELRVLARKADWNLGTIANIEEWWTTSGIGYNSFSNAEECKQTILEQLDILCSPMQEIPSFSFEQAIPKAMDAYKDCLTWLR